jgi:hypothetical protein
MVLRIDFATIPDLCKLGSMIVSCNIAALHF